MVHGSAQNVANSDGELRGTVVVTGRLHSAINAGAGIPVY